MEELVYRAPSKGLHRLLAALCEWPVFASLPSGILSSIAFQAYIEVQRSLTMSDHLPTTPGFLGIKSPCLNTHQTISAT